jgi:hypothetical protein
LFEKLLGWCARSLEIEYAFEYTHHQAREQTFDIHSTQLPSDNPSAFPSFTASGGPMSALTAPVFPTAPAAPVVAGPSMLVDAPVAATWTPWMLRLERLVFKACATTRRNERRARCLTVTLRLENGATVRRALALPRPTAQAAEVMPVALGLLRLLLAEHEGRVARLGVSLSDMVEGADQPIQFERYLARRKQQRLMKLASLLACFGALSSLFALR